MSKRLVIPCLRGSIGSWDTFTCLMQLQDIAQLINFAKDLHTSKKLSEMIQRHLEDDRANDIAEYLINNRDRFFNSLVVAIYDGDPTWHGMQKIRPTNEESEKLDMPDYAQECFGFISLTKEEKMFALDGQHRLSGIKKALGQNGDLGCEQLSVIIVAHKNTPNGIKKSRRLFTTLNKKAKLVKKGAIIALDEDDISACISRWLVESSTCFNEDNVAFIVGSLRDSKSITTLGNIFDCTQKLVAFMLGCKISEIEGMRIIDEKKIYSFVDKFYSNTFNSIEALSETLKSSNHQDIIKKHRNNENGGHLLFRPIGWEIYTETIISLMEQGYSLPEAVDTVKIKDLSLSGEIFKNILWSPQRKRILKVSSAKMKIIKTYLMKPCRA